MPNLRNELKFQVNETDLEILRSRLGRILSVDSHEASDKGYFIRSVYFDDVTNSAFYDKYSGVSEREKFRIRSYNLSDDFIALEKKEKKGDLVSKTQARISVSDLSKLCRGDVRDYLDSPVPLLREFAVKSIAGGLQPKVVVDYFRKTFVSPVSETRVTFDTCLSASTFSEERYFSDDYPTVPIFNPGEAVLEVKFNVFLLPQVKEAVSDIPRIRCANSKYCRCAEALEWSMR